MARGCLQRLFLCKRKKWGIRYRSYCINPDGYMYQQEFLIYDKLKQKQGKDYFPTSRKNVFYVSYDACSNETPVISLQPLFYSLRSTALWIDVKECSPRELSTIVQIRN